MALKSKDWFLGRCLVEERARSKYCYLGARALDLGLRRSGKTAGHIMQACGAAQKFLEEHPEHIGTIAGSDPLEGFDLRGSPQILRDWRQFFANKTGGYGRASFHYNWDSLSTYLTRSLGGVHVGGGGGDSLFEIVLRLVAEFS